MAVKRSARAMAFVLAALLVAVLAGAYGVSGFSRFRLIDDTSCGGTGSGGTGSTSVGFGAYLATAEDGSCLTTQGDSTYTDAGPVNLNGITIAPVSGVVTIDTKAVSIQADNATVSIGNFSVYTGSISTSLVGSFGLSVSASAQIGGLKLAGRLSLVASSSNGLTITAKVTLPKGLGGGTVKLTASTNAADGFYQASIQATNFSIPIRGVKIGLKNFLLSYNVPSNTWKGQIKVGLPTPSGTEVGGSITITSGEVTQFMVMGDNFNYPLGPDGVFLQAIGANIVVAPPPPSITGTATITAGPKIKGVSAVSVDGSLSYIFSDPADFQMTGTLVLLNGTSFSQNLVSGELDYFSDGHITITGHAAIALGNVASLTSDLSGWISGTSAFSLSGQSTIAIGGWHIVGTGVISTAGIAACGQPFGPKGPSVGFGYLWGGSVNLMSSSCGIGAYSESPGAVVPGTSSATPVRISLPANLPVASFELAGQNGQAPSATLTDPAGHKITINPDNQGVFTGSTPKYGLAVDSVKGIDYVVVDAPAGGTWTIRAAGSSAISSVSSAQGLAQPRVSAAVSGKGLRRKLSWRLAALAGQRVTFVEEAPGVDQVLASNLSAGSGSVAFTAADGPAGKRSIVAVISENGLTRETIHVAGYTAPATSSITVTVHDTAGASGHVTITPSGTSCRSTCSFAVLAGKVVTLKPVPGHGSQFTWTSGLCTGTGACRLKITQKTAVTGEFSS